ncbi:MAG TPA: hypothetical protein PKD12_04700 [Nitrospira sp.]|nr:hypothetical protein [Nitrospira sp.]
MSTEQVCPRCSAENVQRVGDIFRTTVSEKALKDLPKALYPPRAPWAYLQGFLLGIPANAAVMLSMGPPQGSESQMAVAELTSSLAFLGVWVGYGRLKTKNHAKKLDEWKETVASKFLCHKCNHSFEG